MKERYAPVFYGVILALGTIFYGEFMATTFGVYESDIKTSLLQEAREHTAGVTVPGHEQETDADKQVFTSEAEAQQIADKAWVYMKRAHTHAEGLGAITLVVALLIGHMALRPLIQRLLSLGISLGGFVYPICLFYAAVWMVDKGTTAAKADVHYFAVSSVMLYIIGIAVVLLLIILRHFRLTRPIRFVFADESEG